jgi:hypothetical protein
MTVSIPRIVRGLELIDDDGDEVVVQKISEAKGTATLGTSDGDSYSISLRELRSKLRDGEFASVYDACAEADDDGDEDSDDD